MVFYRSPNTKQIRHIYINNVKLMYSQTQADQELLKYFMFFVCKVLQLFSVPSSKISSLCVQL